MKAAPQRILIRGVNWLGDAVMTTPALMRVRERFPQASITLLTPEKLGALYLHHPAVDRVLMFSPRESLVTIATWLRDEKFDLGVVLPNSPRSALEMYLGGVRRRVGYARPLRTWMLNDAVVERVEVPKMRKRSRSEIEGRIAQGLPRETFAEEGHHLFHYLRLVGAIGCNPAPLTPLVHVTEQEVSCAAEKFKVRTGGPWLGLNPGAEYGPAKRWPEERFAAAASELHRRTGARWMIFGGRGDRELAGRLAQGIGAAIGAENVRSVAGETNLRELCALLRACRLVLTNDTGPMHVAAAVGTPVIVPFGSTSPELTGPGLPGRSENALILGAASCAPCFLRECPVDFRCMHSITAEQVVARAESMLGTMAGRPGGLNIPVTVPSKPASPQA